MQQSHFYAMLGRMKYITRWGLMRNSSQETLSEHTLEVAVITHALVVVHNQQAGAPIDPGEAVLYALYHDTSEILTGDLPTPVKYHNPGIKNAYKQVEREAREKLVGMLPPEMQPHYGQYMNVKNASERVQQLVKAADKLSALMKCMEEEKMGNREFVQARKTLRDALEAMDLQEVKVFMRDFLPSYALTLDELE